LHAVDASRAPFHHVAGGAAELTAKQRGTMPHSEAWYGASMFVTYCLYPPLYLTGPTMTYNDFVCQARLTRAPQVHFHPVACIQPVDSC
jgi:D-alanyl-lipoteichoic acid acyltransferase DltB (MBOAT superfamily)